METEPVAVFVESINLGSDALCDPLRCLGATEDHGCKPINRPNRINGIKFIDKTAGKRNALHM